MIKQQKIDGITVEQAKTLYNINYDKWVSSCTRSSTFSGKCIGNTEHEHSFNNNSDGGKFPNIYKVVIINNDSGEIKITDVINRTETDSFITINMDTMEVTNNTNEVLTKSNNIFTFIFLVLLTSSTEIMFIIIMKIFNSIKLLNINTILIILILNIVKSLILVVGFVTSISYLFIIIGILVFIAEYFTYKNILKDMSKAAIVISTLIFTIISILFCFIPL